jgi:capsule polysaccharide export protein KpsE/RkpR
MSLPGRWTDEPASTPPPPKPVEKQTRQFQQPNYADPAVTQFCNEHFKELDDLQNIDQLIASLNEQQTVVTTQVIHLRVYCAYKKISESENQLNSLRKDILDKSRTSLSATSTFQSHYHDLTAQISNSWTTNYAQHEGLAQLQSLDSKRRDLLRAKSYIQILLQVSDLR